MFVDGYVGTKVDSSDKVIDGKIISPKIGPWYNLLYCSTLATSTHV